MAQSYTPYSYQANNIFNMGIPDWEKKKWMETPITKAQAESMSNPFMKVNKVDLSGPGKMPVVDASGNVTGSGMHPGIESGYQPNYGVQNQIPSAITVPNSGVPQLGIPDKEIYRTPQGTPAVASGPKLTPEERQTYTGYTKSIDKLFTMAFLQSSMRQNDQTKEEKAATSGGKGGGNRMDQMTPYTSAIPLDEEKYPMLWRYSR